MRRRSLPRIYPLTDSRLTGLSPAEQCRRLIDAGAELIQIREKHASSGEFYKAAAEALAVAREKGARIVINDRVDLALMLGADGVHLGQDDLPPAQARELLGPEALIGYSTHSVEQARAALELPVDYIAVGPVYATRSKEDPDAVVGPEGVRAVRAAVGRFPLVAIGGITPRNVRTVLDAGADSAAVIGALLSDPERIEENFDAFIRAAA